MSRLQRTIEEHFPGLWPAVDVGLAVCASLLLADNSNPVAVIYVGGPSSKKTTVADMFAGHPRCYRSDNFTPAAFVSHAANVGKDKLKEVDLLPRIKGKVLVTPELAPIFRGKEDELTKRFAILTRVLDGQGLVTDSGTHGQRGYDEECLFAWIGCTTPFAEKVWAVMAQLGSRLFFWTMDDAGVVTEDELVESVHGLSYREQLQTCKQAVHQFLTELFEANDGVHGVKWDASADPEDVVRWIARCAQLVAAARSEPQRETEDDDGSADYIPAKREQPYRALQVLRNIARGHALVHGRGQLAEDDLPVVARVAVSSMPTKPRQVFLNLVENGDEPVTAGEVRDALGVSHLDTARAACRDLAAWGIAHFEEHGQGKPAELRFRPEWAWCASPEFRAILADELVKNRGVCAPSAPITPNLAQRQYEREEEERDTHTPQKMTGSSAAVDLGRPA